MKNVEVIKSGQCNKQAKVKIKVSCPYTDTEDLFVFHTPFPTDAKHSLLKCKYFFSLFYKDRIKIAT